MEIHRARGDVSQLTVAVALFASWAAQASKRMTLEDIRLQAPEDQRGSQASSQELKSSQELRSSPGGSSSATLSRPLLRSSAPTLRTEQATKTFLNELYEPANPPSTSASDCCMPTHSRREATRSDLSTTQVGPDPNPQPCPAPQLLRLRFLCSLWGDPNAPGRASKETGVSKC